MFGSKPQKATGVHLAAASVRLVEVAARDGGWGLVGIARRPLDAPVLDELADADGRESLVQALGQLRRMQGLGRGQTLVAVDGDAVLLKRRPLVDARPEVNRQHLIWEASQVLPGEAAAYFVDCLCTDRYGFVAAVPRRLVGACEEVFKRARMQRPIVDVAPFALFNLLEALGLADADSTCIVEPGEEGMRAVLAGGGQLLAVETCPWEEGADTEARLETTVAAVHRLWNLELVDEGPAQLWLVGPAAVDMAVPLTARLDRPCQALDPLAHMDCGAVEDEALLQCGPEFAVAAGLALRGLAGD